MKPYWENKNITIYNADCFDILPHLSNIDMVVTDPPYSSGGMMRSDRMNSCRAKYQNSEAAVVYPEFTGDTMDQFSYIFFARCWMSLMRNAMKDSGLICVFTDWRQINCVTTAMQMAGLIWRGIAVWDKTEASRPVKGRYRNQCEYIIWGTKGPHNDPDGAVAAGCYRQSVFQEKKQHMTEKPVGVMAWLLQIAKPDYTICDPFMGSGTTLKAAQRYGLNAIGIEVEQAYCDIAIKRFDQLEFEQLAN